MLPHQELKDSSLDIDVLSLSLSLSLSLTYALSRFLSAFLSASFLLSSFFLFSHSPMSAVEIILLYYFFSSIKCFIPFFFLPSPICMIIIRIQCEWLTQGLFR